MKQSCILIFMLGFLILPAYSASTEDEIINLPGLLKPPPFKQYSGYLDAIEGRKLHYWFVESELNSTKAPLVLWMNGGPGCSSVYGLLTEHGPFRVSKYGWSLKSNPFSWNKVASVIYLEAPVGVGFSYIPNKNYTSDDNFTALNNLAALQSFFKKFPEFKSNDFYIAGESYGGFYVPTLALLVAEHPDSFNLKGFLVGNGLHSYELNNIGALMFARGHAEFSDTAMLNLITYCCKPASPISCNFYNTTDKKCISAILSASEEITTSGLNPYGIYKRCEKSDGTAHFLVKRYQPLGQFMAMEITKKESPEGDPPCVNSLKERQWINQPSVRQALHIPNTVQNWTVCSDEVGKSYKSIYTNMAWHYKQLLNKELRGLVYHGDTDFMCSFMSGEWFVTSLGLSPVKGFTRWTYDNRTAGVFKQFVNLTFATVLGAGHMVPTDAPGPAFKLASNFLYKKSLD